MTTNILRRASSIFSILVLFAALIVPGGYARSMGTVVFRVPFDFVVAGKTLPAGEYAVERTTLYSAEGLRLRGIEKGAGVFVLTSTVQANEIQNDSKLVFNQYQGQYFLSEFWTSGEESGRKLIKSERERELAKSGTKAEQVAIVAPQK